MKTSFLLLEYSSPNLFVYGLWCKKPQPVCFNDFVQLYGYIYRYLLHKIKQNKTKAK